MDRKKVLILINPNSGKKNSKGQLLDVLNEFSSHMVLCQDLRQLKYLFF